MLSNIIFYGLFTGSVYALLAVGFSLIYGVARVLNLAHTAFYMVAAYGIFFFAVSIGLTPVLAIILSIVIVSTLGYLSYILFIEPIRAHETAVIIITVGLAMLFQETILILFGGHYRGASSIIGGYSMIFGFRVTNQHLLTLGVVILALLAVWILLKRTRLGLAIRSAAQDREIANLMGINVKHVAAITMVIAVVLAAIAGAMVAPIYTLEPHMWLNPLILVLAIVILGGLGSIKGSFFGAFILAFVEVSMVFLVPQGAYLKTTVALAIMVIILLFRPEGLFGVFFEGDR